MKAAIARGIRALTVRQVMFHDVDWLLAHFNGLEQVISQRMRTRALLNPILRIMIFWYVAVADGSCFKITWFLRLIALGLMLTPHSFSVDILAFHALVTYSPLSMPSYYPLFLMQNSCRYVSQKT